MAFWNKKKMDSRILSYFLEHQIPYEIEQNESTKIKFELCLAEKGIIIYPYLTIDENIVSFNVNVVERSLKGFHYETLNDFNLKSPFFKAYITSTGVVVLEYRFVLTEDDKIMDQLIQSLFDLQAEIDSL